MSVKVFGVCLMLYHFLCVFASCKELKITETQFSKFDGSDPTKTCGCKESMEAFCNSIIKSENGKPEKGDFLCGYPECQDADAVVQKDCGNGITLKKVKVIVCAWAEEKLYYPFGKGMTKDHCMSYWTDCATGNVHFEQQLSYKENQQN